MNLMPLGNGHLFLPVKSEIRRKIKKEAPDTVHVTICEDKTPEIIPEELLLCMEDERGVLEKFENYSDGQKKAFIDWINSSKTEQTRIEVWHYLRYLNDFNLSLVCVDYIDIL